MPSKWRGKPFDWRAKYEKSMAERPDRVCEKCKVSKRLIEDNFPRAVCRGFIYTCRECIELARAKKSV